jgi:hypothetical protein
MILRTNSSLPVLLLLALLLGSLASHAQSSSQEKKRGRLLDQLGLEKKQPPPPVAAPKRTAPAPDDEEEEPADPAAPATATTTTTRAPAAPAWVAFVPRVHQLLLAECRSCHQSGRRAARSGFGLTGEPAADYEATKLFVAPSPAKSVLLQAALGHGHSPGAVLEDKSAKASLLSLWISQGAPLDRPAQAASREPDAPAPAPAVAAVPAAEPAPPPSPADEAPHEGAEAGDRPPPPPTTPEEAAAGPSFALEIHPLLEQRCAGCHEPEGMAGASRYVTLSEPEVHYEALRPLVDPSAPGQSLLYRAALGEGHRAVFSESDDEAATLLFWIETGARGPQAARDVNEIDAGDAVEPTKSPVARGEQPLVSPQPILDAMGRVSPLLEGFSLHGRFDLSYERRGYTNNPFAEEATEALRSYHHFLFLSRRSKSDPIGIDVELVTLQFWEVSARHSFGPVDVGGRMGKILVPFGSDPLYHHSYGGLAAFDQRLLPVIWAQEGASVFAYTRLFGLGIGADLFVARGHRLRGENAILNLQADFSPIDDVQLGTGGRLRLSYGPLSAYYSAYLNPLGFDRLLFLQAFDAGLWRPRGVPLLEDIAVSFGAMRSDVSGGGPGRDHYHFGSYFQLRYYPFDFLHLQYRQGLRTFENQRGMYLDPYRLSSQDASTHCLGAVLQWRGALVGVWHFWNLEQVDEIHDDFFRFTVSYAF